MNKAQTLKDVADYYGQSDQFKRQMAYYVQPELQLRHNFMERTLLNTLPNSPLQGFVLDLGCGGGYSINLLSKRIASKIVGVDISPKLCNLAREKNPEAMIIEEDLYKYVRSMSSKSYELVIMLDSLEHIWPERQAEVIQELARIVSVGGYVYIGMPTRLPPEELAQVTEYPLDAEQMREHFKVTELEPVVHTVVTLWFKGDYGQYIYKRAQ